MTAADEVRLGARFLAEQPTHEDRPAEQVRDWSAAACAVGAELALRYQGSTVDGVVARLGLRVAATTGGVRDAALTLARYGTRPPTVTVFTDAVAKAEAAIEAYPWYRPDLVRDTAVAHEIAHHLLHTADRAVLKRRLDHVVLRVGRIALRGHVLGADEVAAHAFARRLCGLPVSPLLISAALSGRAPVAAGRED